MEQDTESRIDVRESIDFALEQADIAHDAEDTRREAFWLGLAMDAIEAMP